MSERKKLKRWQKIRLLRICILITFTMIFIVVIMLIRAGYIWPVMPSISPDSIVTMRKGADGWRLTWSSGENATEHIIEVFRDNSEGACLFSAATEGNEYLLPADLPENSMICLRITPRKVYRLFNIKGNVTEGDPLDMNCKLRETDRYVPEWRVDAERKTLTIGCAGGGNDIYHLYKVEANGELKEVSRIQYTAMDKNGTGYGEMVVGFGDDRDFPMPESDEVMKFVLMAERVEGNLRIWEELNDTMNVVRNDLLSNELTAEVTDLGENRYMISFTETAGKGYRVQCRDENSFIWDNLAEYTVEDERTYITERLPAGRQIRYRVTSINEGSTPWTQTEVIINTGYTPIYATVWPVKELPVYTNPYRTEIRDHVAVGTALCVLAEENGMFKVYMPDGDAYIESSSCMINLADYFGGLCSYDITNSYFSLYMAHDHELYDISGTIIPGYENILLEDGTFLVPLLYPVAQRLATAVEATVNDGYRLKIYDTFRPYIATRYIYDTTAAMLDQPAPPEIMERLTLPEYLSLHYYEEEQGTVSSEVFVQEEPVPGEGEVPADDTVPPEELITYRQLITNASYGLDFFLAKSGSRHNHGVALDLTMERKDNSMELRMQTNIHDLSYNSIQSLNNGEAKLLQEYMYNAGFAGLVSEWWHFQDNDAYSRYLPPSVYNGVSVEGWKADNIGIRYRKADGSYMMDSIQTIGGQEYHFSVDGYVE